MMPPKPEWERIGRLFTALPWDVREWGDALREARQEVLAFVRAVAQAGTPVTLFVRPDDTVDVDGIDTVELSYGDIWLRDSGPVFADQKAHCFRFNGWGGKYVMKGDEIVAEAIAQQLNAEAVLHDFVLEGGAIDHDGTGTAITTRQCLLNPNRNPDMSQADLEAALADTLGLTRIVWLGNGLQNDHTDGHVDNLARFVAPGHAVVPFPDGGGDPNAIVYADAAMALSGAGLQVSHIPSPGRVLDDHGNVVPASYANFVLTNELVVVPQFGVENDQAAVSALAELFPGRRAIGLSARAILAGGGAFHCMTNQVPE